MYIWNAVNVNAILMKQSLHDLHGCLNHVFLVAATDTCPGCEKPSSRGPTISKDMLENALSDDANWQTQESGAALKSFKSLLG